MEEVVDHGCQTLHKFLARLKELIYGKCSKVLEEVDSGS